MFMLGIAIQYCSFLSSHNVKAKTKVANKLLFTWKEHVRQSTVFYDAEALIL